MGQCSGKRPSSRVGPVGNGTTAVQLVDNIGAVTAADADAHLSSRAQARASKVGVETVEGCARSWNPSGYLA